MELTGFEVIEELGKGGMATVYKGRQVSLDRIVAIKILSSKWAADAADVVRFQDEARAAAKLKHSSIVQVYDFNAEQGLYYFVMEYIDGYTVGDWLRRKKRLSQKDALLVVDCVADALNYAWEQAGIVHCDIKPDNVMVDADGTVKVADLGLARTIQAMSVAGELEEVLGTPQYISPEQAMGKADLDCRADIYSLGAMLYHLVTGKMLFEGESEERIIDLQVSDTVEDALDLNSKVSRPLCWLLERMLAKDRDLRPRDWRAVREEIQRVRKGLMPSGKKLPKGISTMRRSARRVHREPVAPAGMRQQRGRKSESTAGPKIAIASVLAVVIVVGLLILKNQTSRASSGRGGHTVRPVPTRDGGGGVTRAQKLYERAATWERNNPESYDEAIQRYEHAARNAKGSPYAMKAQNAVDRLNRAKADRVRQVMREIRGFTAPLVSSNRFAEALALCENYSGDWARATEVPRLKLAGEIQRERDAYEARAAEAAEKLAARRRDVLNDVYGKLLKEGVAACHEAVVAHRNDPELAALQEQLKPMERALDDTLAVHKTLLRSFSGLIGENMTLELKDGKVACRIVGIEDGRVEAEEDLGTGGATRPFSFDVADLAPREMMKRVGTESPPPVALIKGVMAFEAKAWTHARRYFEMCDDALKSGLLACVDQVENQLLETRAEHDLARIIIGCGANISNFDELEWLDAVNRIALTTDRAATVLRSLEVYKRRYEDSPFLEKAAAVMDALDEVLEAARRPDPDPDPAMPDPEPEPDIEPEPGPDGMLEKRPADDGPPAARNGNGAKKPKRKAFSDDDFLDL